MRKLTKPQIDMIIFELHDNIQFYDVDAQPNNHSVLQEIEKVLKEKLGNKSKRDNELPSAETK